MLASILFYKTEKISNNEENRIIGFSFTWSQVCRVIAVYDVASKNMGWNMGLGDVRHQRLI